jgi:NAD(P)-dependent dehydrogenase (short-subunit alcohol dehydrogenase family)
VKKKVLIIGATGTIGSAVVSELERDCDVIKVGRSSGDETVDIANSKSIAELYNKFNDVDAVVCVAARGVMFAPLAEMTIETYLQSMQSKLLGQVALVVQGIKRLGQETSFTLTTGLLNHDPIAAGTAAGMINGAIEGFVRAAAIDMPGKQRINVVSPALLSESVEKYRDFFHGYQPVPAASVALAYRKSVMGHQTGQVMRIGWSLQP